MNKKETIKRLKELKKVCPFSDIYGSWYSSPALVMQMYINPKCKGGCVSELSDQHGVVNDMHQAEFDIIDYYENDNQEFNEDDLVDNYFYHIDECINYLGSFNRKAVV